MVVIEVDLEEGTLEEEAEEDMATVVDSREAWVRLALSFLVEDSTDSCDL